MAARRLALALSALLIAIAAPPAAANAPRPAPPPGSDIIAVLEERAVGLRADEAKLNAAITADDEALARLALRRGELDLESARLRRELDAVRAQKARHASAMLEAVAGAIVGRPGKTEELLPQPGRETSALVAQSLSGAAADHLRALVRADERQEAIFDKQLKATTAALATVVTKQAEVTSARLARIAERDTVVARIAEVRRNIAKQGAVSVLPGVDVPVIVLDAHLRAARRMLSLDPQCKATWWILAAIGAVESANAKGRKIDAAGNIDLIIGPVLDGTNGTAEIKDTDEGKLDEDKEFDRAVGPMQFIPTTWAIWGTDGNADGEISPSNIYDASLSAARYLCASRGSDPLDTPIGLGRAAFAYNHSLSYVAHVLRTASEFQRADFVPSRTVTIAIGSKVATATSALTDRLRVAGWEPVIAGTGDTAALERKLVQEEGVPVAIRGTVVVIADSAADRELALLVEAAEKSTAGLRTIVVVPAVPVPDALLRGRAPHVKIVSVPAFWLAPPTAPPPGGAAAPAPDAGALAAAWLDQVVAQIG